MKHPIKTLIVLGALFCVAGCDEKKPPDAPAPQAATRSEKPTPPAAPVAEKPATPQTVLVVEKAGAANESLQKEREQLETQRRELTAKLEQEAASGSIWTVNLTVNGRSKSAFVSESQAEPLSRLLNTDVEKAIQAAVQKGILERSIPPT